MILYKLGIGYILLVDHIYIQIPKAYISLLVVIIEETIPKEPFLSFLKTFLLLFFTFSAFADVSLDDAYKRERAFLTAQKEALLKMKSGLLAQHTQRKNRAQQEITEKERELSSLMMKNQELHEEFKAIEKATKESSQMSGQLEKNALKISETLRVFKSKKLARPARLSLIFRSIKI